MISGKCKCCGAPITTRGTRIYCGHSCQMRQRNIDKARAVRATPPPKAPAGARWLPLDQGLFALVDATLFPALSTLTWSFAHGYARNITSGVYLHRAALGFPRSQVDHINGDGLNCRRSNLRCATSAVNARNARASVHASRYKGVSRKRNRWEARLAVGPRGASRVVARSTFATEEEAARAYDRYARHHFGAAAALNFAGPGEQSALRGRR